MIKNSNFKHHNRKHDWCTTQASNTSNRTVKYRSRINTPASEKATPSMPSKERMDLTRLYSMTGFKHPWQIIASTCKNWFLRIEIIQHCPKQHQVLTHNEQSNGHDENSTMKTIACEEFCQSRSFSPQRFNRHSPRRQSTLSLWNKI